MLPATSASANAARSKVMSLATSAFTDADSNKSNVASDVGFHRRRQATKVLPLATSACTNAASETIPWGGGRDISNHSKMGMAPSARLEP